VNSALQLESKLAKGIAFHLNFGWFFLLNGLAYMFFLSRRGQWRHIVPNVQGVKDAGQSVAHDLHLAKAKPVQGKYNAAQQVTDSAVIVIAFLLVATGFAIYKPGQLAWLEAMFGGCDYARFIHFSTMSLLMSFFLIQILHVVRAGWSKFASMITGYRRDRKDSPEVAPPAAFGPDAIGDELVHTPETSEP
jgi:thiosulfate reductase cytochrome b subunit